MSIGSANEVGRAQLKPMPFAGGHEHQRRVGVLQHAVDHDVVLGQEVRQRHPAALAQRTAAARVARVAIEVHDARRVDGRANRAGRPVGQHIDVRHAMGVQRRHRSPAGRPEADDGRPQAAAVLARRPDELHGVQHRAVPGQLVVLVEDVQAERAVGGPVVHRLEGDQRQPPVDAQLGDLLVLHAVRPAPQDLPFPQAGQILGQRLGQQDDIAAGDELITGPQAGDHGRQLLVGHPELIAVTALEVQALAQVSIDPLDMQRVDRQPALVLLPRP